MTKNVGAAADAAELLDTLPLYEIPAHDSYADAWRGCYSASGPRGRFFVAHESVFLELLRGASGALPRESAQ